MPHVGSIRSVALLIALAGYLTAGPVLAAVQILNVSHAPAAFDPATGEALAVSFRLSEAAAVELQIIDSRQVQVRSVPSAGALNAGDHTLRWDGRDSAGNVVLAEAYSYRLRATGAGGESQLWDLFESSGGETLNLSPAWDLQQGAVRYALPSAARVVLRAGLEDGGPLLQTIANWPVRAEGEHVEPWNGREDSSLFQLARHPKLRLTLQAYTMPLNTVVVGRPGLSVPRWPRRVGERPGRGALRKRPVAGLRRADALGDCRLEIAPVNAGVSRENGGVVARGPLELRIDVPASERERILAERFEVAVFLDGVLVFENEVGFLPVTWTWDPQAVPPGVHTVTANLWGYEGSMGTGSLRVVAAPMTPTEPGE